MSSGPGSQRDPGARDGAAGAGEVGAMGLHPREQIVVDAEIELRSTMLRIMARLTTGELLAVVSRVLGEQIGGAAKFMIRRERHGNEDHPGGME